MSIPILASLNGATARGWVRFAKEIEQAGADAIELNTYSLATGFTETSATIEKGIVQLVRQVKEATPDSCSQSNFLRNTQAFPT